jgi:hypothetical protein
VIESLLLELTCSVFDPDRKTTETVGSVRVSSVSAARAFAVRLGRVARNERRTFIPDRTVSNQLEKRIVRSLRL